MQLAYHDNRGRIMRLGDDESLSWRFPPSDRKKFRKTTTWSVYAQIRYRGKIKSPTYSHCVATRNARPSNQENGRSRCCPFISLFSFTRLDPRNYVRVLFSSTSFFLLFCALLQKLIAENVVTYALFEYRIKQTV